MRKETVDGLQYIDEPGPDGDLWGWSGPGWYFWDEAQTMAYGPYSERSTAYLALANYVQTLEALRSDGKGLYIHLMEKENQDEQPE